MDTPDMRDEANLPPLVADLLAEGRAVIEAERRERELREEAAAGARRALLKTNTRTAIDELLRLEPRLARLIPFADVVDHDMNYRVPPEFYGMQFKIAVPGFQPVIVWVQRRKVALAGPPVEHAWTPWELGGQKPYKVEVPESGGSEYASLGVALAAAREWWLKLNKDGDVPF